MEKIDLLKYRGNVLKYEAFCKMNERLDVDIQSPDEIIVGTELDEIITNAVSSLIEQICGWDIDILKAHIAKEFGKKNASRKDMIIWLMQQVDNYINQEIDIKGEDFIRKDKREEFLTGLLAINYKMIIEKLIRRLRHIDDDDKYPPIYIQELIELIDDCIEDTDEEEEE